MTLELTTVNTSDTDSTKQIRVETRLRDRDGLKDHATAAQSFDVPFPAGEAVTSITYELNEEPVYWSEYSPVIYELISLLYRQ